jgi:polyphosphate kinase 2 (PPK2 family)
MFEAAELGVEVDKATWDKQAPAAREDLLQIQRELATSKFSCVVLVGGVEGGGKRGVVSFLLEWMDARGIKTHVLREPTEEELDHPAAWRYWIRLPPTGRMGIFLGSWYTQPIVDRVYGRIKDKALEVALDRAVEFERMLVNENVIVIKLWMHVSKKDQKKRFKELSSHKDTRWRVTKRDWKYLERYDDFREVSEHTLQRTSTGEAPWHIVEATDERHRNLTVARIVTDALKARLSARKPPVSKTVAPAKVVKISGKSLLSELDQSLSVSRKKYEKKLPRLQARLHDLTAKLAEKGKSLILVFEGPDAAGKGGTIRRVTAAMDPGNWDTVSIAAPTDEERAHPYLWRFGRARPRSG